MIYRRYRVLLALGCIVVALTAAPVWARGEWYDFYEDALEALEAGDPQRAVQALEAALQRKKRSGYLRTYGNNYLRYVPHYYLGVAYHGVGDCERALASFDRSEAARETEPLPEAAARMRSLRADCAPPPEPPPAPAVAALEPSTTPEAPRVSLDSELLAGGLRSYIAGDLQDAVRAFEKLASSAPSSPHAHLLLGMALHALWVTQEERDEALLERVHDELATAAQLAPDLVPDPALCPPRVVALYRSLR